MALALYLCGIEAGGEHYMRPELPVLIKARAKIADPAKWGRGMRGNGHRPRETSCAAEAIEDVIPEHEHHELRRAAYTALVRAAGINPKFDDITRWNDAPQRSHADVLAAFDKAIEGAS